MRPVSGYRAKRKRRSPLWGWVAQVQGGALVGSTIAEKVLVGRGPSRVAQCGPWSAVMSMRWRHVSFRMRVQLVLFLRWPLVVVPAHPFRSYFLEFQAGPRYTRLMCSCSFDCNFVDILAQFIRRLKGLVNVIQSNPNTRQHGLYYVKPRTCFFVGLQIRPKHVWWSVCSEAQTKINVKSDVVWMTIRSEDVRCCSCSYSKQWKGLTDHNSGVWNSFETRN